MILKHQALNIVIDTDYAQAPMIYYKNGIKDPDIYLSVKFDQLKELGFIKLPDVSTGQE